MTPNEIIASTTTLVTILVIAISYSYSWGKRKGFKEPRELNEEEMKRYSLNRIDILQEVINRVELNNEIHPIVKIIYKEFVELAPHGFKPINVEMTIPSLGIKWWDANEDYGTKFTAVSYEMQSTFNQTVPEINKALTKADRVILDTISRRVRVNNKEFIERIFIK